MGTPSAISMPPTHTVLPPAVPPAVPAHIRTCHPPSCALPTGPLRATRPVRAAHLPPPACHRPLPAPSAVSVPPTHTVCAAYVRGHPHTCHSHHARHLPSHVALTCPT